MRQTRVEQDEAGETDSNEGMKSLVGQDKGNRCYFRHKDDMRGF